MKKLPQNEFTLIRFLTRNISSTKKSGVKVGIGDDCAVISKNDDTYTLATCDAQVEGVHFFPDSKPEYIGKKAIAVNVSDIAACGGRPTTCLVSLIVPKSLDTKFLDRLYAGIKSASNTYDVQVIGGNMSSGKELIVDIFMLGAVKKKELILRNGAKPGDKILVTGFLGKAARAIAQKRNPRLPEARIKESTAIARIRRATSMIDLSDGLSGDIGHICDSSKVGVEIYSNLLPLARGASIDNAVNDGEDYELLFTAPPASVEPIKRSIKKVSDINVSVIGEVLPKKDGRWIIDKKGRRIRLLSKGWDHLRS